jgi:hypothetical protein
VQASSTERRLLGMTSAAQQHGATTRARQETCSAACRFRLEREQVSAGFASTSSGSRVRLPKPDQVRQAFLVCFGSVSGLRKRCSDSEALERRKSTASEHLFVVPDRRPSGSRSLDRERPSEVCLLGYKLVLPTPTRVLRFRLLVRVRHFELLSQVRTDSTNAYARFKMLVRNRIFRLEESNKIEFRQRLRAY